METLVWLLIIYVNDPMPAAHAIEQWAAILASTDNHKVRAYAVIERGVPQAMRGRLHAARRDVADGRALLQDQGLTLAAAITTFESAMVEALAGTPSSVRPALISAREPLEQAGEQCVARSIEYGLAEIAWIDSDPDEALRLIDRTEAAASGDDPHVQISWRRIKALALADRGDFDAADRLAREAVELAFATRQPDSPWRHQPRPRYRSRPRAGPRKPRRRTSALDRNSSSKAISSLPQGRALAAPSTASTCAPPGLRARAGARRRREPRCDSGCLTRSLGALQGCAGPR